MIKILFFIPGLLEGGAEKVLLNLVNNMEQRKFEITVQTLDKYDPSQYLSKGIRYKAVNRCKTKVGKKIFSYFFRLCAELKVAYHLFVRDDYDIEVAYLETVPTKIIAQSTNRKAVKLAWVHCDLSIKEGVNASVEKVRKQYKQFDKIVCVSEDVKIGFHKVYGDDFNTVVLHNVIDEKEIFLKADEPIAWKETSEGKRLVAVGRLTQQKNFAYLIETCKILKEKGYKFYLSILGEGPERMNLEKQIETMNLKDVVALRGFVNNPYPLMKNADIIVCSSSYEGISTVVQEALILGKTVVTTMCTGMKELLGNSEYGIIANVGLVDALQRVLDNPALEQHYSIAAKKRGTDFYKSKIVRETEIFFEENYRKKKNLKPKGR